MTFNTSDLILNTKNYSFSPFEHKGLGGVTKYIATAKSSTGPQKLIVKHNCEYAATSNGFVYGRIGELLGMKMPKTYMFEIAPQDRRLFESSCVMGMEFIEGFRAIDTEAVKADPKLEKAFVECFVLHAILSDFDDNTQMAYVPGDTIYPFDFDDSFWFEKGLFNFMLKYPNLAETQAKSTLSAAMNKGVNFKYGACYKILCQELGYTPEKKELPYFFEMLERFCALEDEEVQSITDALFELFPDLVSIFYEEYIKIMQECTRDYIQRNKP